MMNVSSVNPLSQPELEEVYERFERYSKMQHPLDWSHVIVGRILATLRKMKIPMPSAPDTAHELLRLSKRPPYKNIRLTLEEAANEINHQRRDYGQLYNAILGVEKLCEYWCDLKEATDVTAPMLASRILEMLK